MGKGDQGDMIMIASLNREAKEVKLVSVFRDTLLELEDGNINMIMTAQVREEAEVLIHGAIVVQELEAERQTSPEQEPAVE